MTINDGVIDSIINSLKGVVGRKVGEIEDINVIMSGLDAIREKHGSLPVDHFIGTEMSEERRQTIYDNCIAKAETILDKDDNDE